LTIVGMFEMEIVSQMGMSCTRLMRLHSTASLHGVTPRRGRGSRRTHRRGLLGSNVNPNIDRDFLRRLQGNFNWEIDVRIRIYDGNIQVCDVCIP